MHLRSKLPKTEWFATPNTSNSKTKSQNDKYVYDNKIAKWKSWNRIFIFARNLPWWRTGEETTTLLFRPYIKAKYIYFLPWWKLCLPIITRSSRPQWWARARANYGFLKHSSSILCIELDKKSAAGRQAYRQNTQEINLWEKIRHATSQITGVLGWTRHRTGK